MTQGFNQQSMNAMFTSIAGRYDLLNDVLSFGIHRWWRRKLFRSLEDVNGRVALDLCTGSGGFLLPLSRHFSTVIGMDICLPMLEVASRACGPGTAGCSLVQGDVHAIPLSSESVDIVTAGFGVRNFLNLEKGLSEIHRILRGEGIFCVLELGQPGPVWMRRIYRWYSEQVMPVVGAVLSRNRGAYEYLKNSAARFPCGSNFGRILSEGGFKVLKIEPLTLGIAYLYVARKVYSGDLKAAGS